MTREEVIEYVNAQLDKAVDDVDFMDDEMYEALQTLVKIAERKPRVDLDELKCKILMEVDGGTDDKWLRYADVCDRISDSIDKYKAESEGKEWQI